MLLQLLVRFSIAFAGRAVLRAEDLRDVAQHDDDVEQAQQKIVDVVRRLEDSGEIVIAGRGGEKEMIV